MGNRGNFPLPLCDFWESLRQVVREEFQDAMGQNGHPTELLTAEELAKRLKVPSSWVYEQSRQGNIPTHRIGRYIRFDLEEVLTRLNPSRGGKF